jgi:hypothetical protein
MDIGIVMDIDYTIRKVKFKYGLVSCPCVATAYNNTHVNCPSKKFKIFY